MSIRFSLSGYSPEPYSMLRYRLTRLQPRAMIFILVTAFQPTPLLECPLPDLGRNEYRRPRGSTAAESESSLEHLEHLDLGPSIDDEDVVPQTLGISPKKPSAAPEDEITEFQREEESFTNFPDQSIPATGSSPFEPGFEDFLEKERIDRLRWAIAAANTDRPLCDQLTLEDVYRANSSRLNAQKNWLKVTRSGEYEEDTFVDEASTIVAPPPSPCTSVPSPNMENVSQFDDMNGFSCLHRLPDKPSFKEYRETTMRILKRGSPPRNSFWQTSHHTEDSPVPTPAYAASVANENEEDNWKEDDDGKEWKWEGGY